MTKYLDWETLEPVVTRMGAQALAAAAVLFVGWIAVRLLVGVSRRAMRRAGADEILSRFLATVLRYALLSVVAVAALERIGVQTASLIAALGAIGLAVGLALKDSLSNFAAGLMLIVQRPFAKDDFVEAAGTSGIVEDISLVSTTLRTPDNRSVVVPNGAITNDVITNYSRRDTRRVDMIFGISYDDDIDRAREVIRQVLTAESRILEEPKPVIAVHELADSSVNFVVRPWAKTEDYWDVYWAVHEQVKLALDEAGISFPFPQTDVHLHQVA